MGEDCRPISEKAEEMSRSISKLGSAIGWAKKGEMDQGSGSLHQP